MNKSFVKLGIIGCPLSHSISPIIQKAAIHSADLNGFYEKFEVTKEQLQYQLEFFIKNQYNGFNVTIPYKVEVMKYLDEIDESALKIGAVNTIKIFSDGKLKGFNTDVYGFYNSLKGRTFNNAKLLGCGGAALAIVFGLEMAGCKEITVCARNKEKAINFIKSVQNKTAIRFDYENFSEIKTLADTDILVNATPLGTKGNNENLSPINKEYFKTATKDLFVYDLVYNPQETLFLKNAGEFELNYMNGLDMLVLQGAKAFEIWSGAKPDISLMKKVAKNAL